MKIQINLRIIKGIKTAFVNKTSNFPNYNYNKKVLSQCVLSLSYKGDGACWTPVLPQCYYCTAGDLSVNVKPPCCK